MRRPLNVPILAVIVLAVIVAAAANPAMGQNAVPAVDLAGTSGPEKTAGIPDLSGIWAHFTCCEFEPPLAGPGPVTNRSRRNGISNNYQWVGDYTNPILKPRAAQVVEEHGRISLAGSRYPTPSNQCWPEGIPYVFWNIGIEIIQHADAVTILYSNDHEVRRVRMNAPHPAHVTPSWYGDSVGHYEGDTLVIDTLGFKVGPFTMLDVYGTPYSQGMHIVERYRLLDREAAKAAEERGQKGIAHIQTSDPGFARDAGYDGKGLQLHFTVEDDAVFTMPWSADVTYQRPSSPLGEWPEFVCAENPDAGLNGTHIALPVAEKPDF